MGRQRKGAIVERDSKLYARVRFIDDTGRKRDIWKRVGSRKQARETIKEMLREIDDHGFNSLDKSNMTFADLADIFQEHYLTPAEYIGERKVSGVRSITPVLAALKALREHFGNRRLRSITYSEIRTYKAIRLNTPTKHNGQRSIATVNRELCKMRRLMNIALREGWILKNPFTAGESLVSAADENKRERILTRDEEIRLLTAIDAEPKRSHLKGMLLLALDCALRRGEIFTLAWSDIDFKQRTVTIRAMNAKTARSRTVAMTTRLYAELESLRQDSSQDARALVFGVRVTIKTAWLKALKKAEISDYHFHDCRHTAITRMIQAGMPPTQVMRISGHTTMSAFFRYVNTDEETATRAAALLDAFNSQHLPEADATVAESLELVH